MELKRDSAHLTAWRLFITAHARLIEQIDGELAAAGCIHLQWYDVLIELVEAPERRLRMSDLAARVVLSRSTVTRLADRLEAEGLLERQRSSTDRRGAYAVLTERGMAAVRSAWPVYARGIARHFARHLSEDEARAMTDALTRVINGLARKPS
jgi:DNA-binding MarR family transcriptional regulator